MYSHVDSYAPEPAGSVQFRKLHRSSISAGDFPASFLPDPAEFEDRNLNKIFSSYMPRSTNPILDPTFLQNPIGFLVTDLYWVPSVKFPSEAAYFITVLWPPVGSKYRIDRPECAGATRKDTGGLLVNEDLGECFKLSIKQNYYEIIYRDRSQSCYQIFNRTKNINQIRKSSCGETTSLVSNQMNFDDLCRSIDEQSEFITLFLKTYSAEECRRTIYRTFHFTYEFREGGIGICDNPSSRLVSCPDPGTPFEAVNERFWMTYGYCRDLVSSIDAQPLYQCLGYWINDKGDVFTGIANKRVGSERWYDKFRCMLTRQDQPQWFAKSLFAECSRLYSPTDGPEKVIITPVVPEVPTPTCFFPDNFTGEWVNTANVNARTIINSTHIHEISQVNNRGWLRETYYVCQQISRQQYLVKTVTKGECFSYYICFDFKDRHHNILRYRKSKSFMSNVYDDLSKRDPLYEVCSWTSFGNDANWKYQVFVLDPPSPIECPFTIS
ncbi:hypothetical protein I4U23_031275 [Adineta vaga]|nr:hypothetical protein I4U23_031275 [Adineta vaga]